MATTSEPLEFWVNGRKIVDPNPDPEETLGFYLRSKRAWACLSGRWSPSPFFSPVQSFFV
jgi:hypothetical protein